MKIFHRVLIIGFVGLLVSGTVSASASVEFNSYVPISGYRASPIFKFSKTVLIDYPNGGKIKNELDGKNFAVEFFGDSDNNTSIKSLMQKIDAQIATGKKNPAYLTDLSMIYQALIHGDNKQASIDYAIILKPTLVNYVLSKGGTDTPTVFDMSWMGFDIQEPITITTAQYGDMEINFPLGLIQNQLPNVYDSIKGTSAEDALDKNLIDSMPLVNYSIDKWETLYDPAYVLDEHAGPEYTGQKTAVTSFAYGSGVNQDLAKQEITKIDFTSDVKYSLGMIENPSTGTINAEGHANGYLIQGMPAISTVMVYRDFNPSATGPWWTGMQGTILWFAVAGSGMVLFWTLYFRRFRE